MPRRAPAPPARPALAIVRADAPATPSAEKSPAKSKVPGVTIFRGAGDAAYTLLGQRRDGSVLVEVRADFDALEIREVAEWLSAFVQAHDYTRTTLTLAPRGGA